MNLGRVVIAGSALVFAAIGAGFLLAPAELADMIDITLGSVSARNDFRAVYGGVPAGLALFLVLAWRRPVWERPALVVVAVTLGGLALARVQGWLVDGWPSPFLLGLFAVEAAGTALALVAIRAQVRETRARANAAG